MEQSPFKGMKTFFFVYFMILMLALTFIGVMGWLGYAYSCEAGSWMLLRAEDGAEIALMTDGRDGLSAGAMGAYDGVIFLADEQARVYVYGEEAYVTDDVLGLLGASVLMVEGVPVIGE